MKMIQYNTHGSICNDLGHTLFVRFCLTRRFFGWPAHSIALPKKAQSLSSYYFVLFISQNKLLFSIFFVLNIIYFVLNNKISFEESPPTLNRFALFSHNSESHQYFSVNAKIPIFRAFVGARGSITIWTIRVLLHSNVCASISNGSSCNKQTPAYHRNRYRLHIDTDIRSTESYQAHNMREYVGRAQAIGYLVFAGGGRVAGGVAASFIAERETRFSILFDCTRACARVRSFIVHDDVFPNGLHKATRTHTHSVFVS